MSRSIKSLHPHSEPEYVTNWGNVVAAAVLGCVVVVVLGAMWLMSGPELAGDMVARTKVDLRPHISKPIHRQVIEQVVQLDPQSNSPWSDLSNERTFLTPSDDLAEPFGDSPAADLPETDLVDVPEIAKGENVVPATPDVESPSIVNTWGDWSRPMAEVDLVNYLNLMVPRVDLDADSSTRVQLMAAFPKESPSRSVFKLDKPDVPSQQPIEITQVFRERADFAGLPIRQADACRLNTTKAKTLAETSLAINRYIASLRIYQQKLDQVRAKYHVESLSTEFYSREVAAMKEKVSQREELIIQKLLETKDFADAARIPALVQMLQAEGPAFRQMLIKILHKIDGKEASREIARRALFDLDPGIRQFANLTLAKRPAEEFRQTLLDGFQYPWPPVASHAANALIVTKDVDAIDALVELLDAPDPNAPVQDEKGAWYVKEMVAINHLSNCLMCHATSTNRSDPVRGLIPSPGEPIPFAYYNSSKG